MKLGAHGVADPLTCLRLQQAGAECVQVFLGDPRVVDFPVVTEKYKLKFLGLIPVIHSPYWVSMWDDRWFKLTLRHIWQVSDVLAKLWPDEQLFYVCHLGKTSIKDEFFLRSKLVERIKAIQFRKFAPNLKICLENEALKQEHAIKLSWLEEAVEGTTVGLCCDFEHAFASGEDLGAIDLSKYEVLHLNALPLYVKKGGGCDRHSYTKLIDGHREIDLILNQVASFKGKRVIMERRDLSVSVVDLIYVRGLYDSRTNS